jgi:adenylylsulfate kinase
LLLHGDFLEIYCRCPAEICEERDPKGHYKRAREGELKGFTGVSGPYEEPLDPELVLDTATIVNRRVGRKRPGALARPWCFG